MRERYLGRRSFIKEITAASTLAAAVLPGTARAQENPQEPHWADKFIWVSEGGVPEAALAPDWEFGEFVAIIEPGKTGVGVFSQFIYDAVDPVTGRQMVIPGRVNHPIVVAVSSHHNQTAERHFGNMPVRSGWFGVIENPGGVAVLSVSQLAEVVTIRKITLADPANNNCIPSIGCQGPIEHVIIGWGGDILEHALPPGVDLNTRLPSEKPAQPVPAPEPAKDAEINIVGVKRGETVVVKSGDLFVGDIQVGGKVLHDNRADTGLIVIFNKDAKVGALFGGNWFQNVPSGKRDEILDMLVNSMKASGCEGGCKDVEIKDQDGNLLARK